MSRNNGGIIGPTNTPTPSSTSGIWSLNQQQLSLKQDIWPRVVVPTIEILLIAGGASGAKSGNGGSPAGGAGGYIEHPSLAVSSGVTYSITIGGGGAGSSPAAGSWSSNDGTNSTFGSLLTALGGGGHNKYSQRPQHHYD